MTSQKMAFLQTVIHNNLIGGSVDKKPGDAAVPVLIWQLLPTDLQHTNPQARAMSGGVESRETGFLHASNKGRPENPVRMGTKAHMAKEERPDFFTCSKWSAEKQQRLGLRMETRWPQSQHDWK